MKFNVYLPFVVALMFSAAALARTPDPYQPSTVSDDLFAQVSKARDKRLGQNPGLAIKSLEPIVQAHPDYFLARYNLGLAYQAVDNTAGAIVQLEAAKQLNVTLHLNEPTISNSLGSLYLRAGNYKEALAELQSAAAVDNIRKLDPDGRRVVFNNLGLAFARNNNSCAANAAYDLAKASDAPATASEDGALTGTWIVGQWQVSDSSLRGRKHRWAVWGSLRIEAKRTRGSFNGSLTLCVTDPYSAPAFLVTETFSITEAGQGVKMNGRVFAGALDWSDDTITANHATDSLIGTSSNRYSAEAPDRVRFDKLW